MSRKLQNHIFGQSNRTQLSDARKTICRSRSRQSKERVHNGEDDDDDDGVYFLHAAVNEERVKAYGPGRACSLLFTFVTSAVYCTCTCVYGPPRVNLSTCPWLLPDPVVVSHSFPVSAACFIVTLYSSHSPTMSSSSSSSTTPTSTMSSSSMSISSSRTMLGKS